MPPVAGGIEGEFQGRVYPVVIGLKAGPSLMHYFGKGTKWHEDGAWLIVEEPDGNGGFNHTQIPQENVAFIAQPMFVIQKPEK